MSRKIFIVLLTSFFGTAIRARPIHHNFIKGHRQTSTEQLNMSGPVSTIPFPPLSPFSPDLDAYFARIKFVGPRNADLETLRELHWCQLKSIPFENLNIHIGHKISSDPKAVEDKLVRTKRGGYCFEQNVLLLHVLRALGYKVTPLTARVLMGKPTDRVSGLTHILLRVECEGLSWLVDVGFGHYGPPKPLLIGINGNSEHLRTTAEISYHFLPYLIVS
jgi:arylamine N-acetyltransferase